VVAELVQAAFAELRTAGGAVAEVREALDAETAGLAVLELRARGAVVGVQLQSLIPSLPVRRGDLPDVVLIALIAVAQHVPVLVILEVGRGVARDAKMTRMSSGINGLLYGRTLCK
jgi:hypothetical protein